MKWFFMLYLLLCIYMTLKSCPCCCHCCCPCISFKTWNLWLVMRYREVAGGRRFGRVFAQAGSSLSAHLSVSCREHEGTCSSCVCRLTVTPPEARLDWSNLCVCAFRICTPLTFPLPRSRACRGGAESSEFLST